MIGKTTQSWWICLVAGLCLLAPFGATAKESPTLVTLKLDADEVDAKTVAAVEKAINDEVAARPDYKRLPTPDSPVLDLMFDAECIDSDVECFVTIGKSLKADIVIYASMDGPEKVNVMVVDVNESKELGSFAFAAASGAGLAAGIAPGMASSLGEKPAPEPPPAPAPVVKKEPKKKPKKEVKKEPKKLDTPMKVSVTTDPEGAFIYVNNKRIGKSPLEFQQKPGKYTLRVLKPGYGDTLRELEVKDKPIALRLKLSEGSAAVAVVPVAGAGGANASSNDKEEFYETWWFWTSVGVGVALISVGAAAGAGAFDSDPAKTGDVSFTFESGAEKDFLLQAQRR